MPLARYRVVTEAGEPIVVEVDGEPLLRGGVVNGVSLATDGATPRLVVSVSAEAELAGEAVVVVERPADGGDEIEYLQQWVANLDVGELDRLAAQLAPPTLNTSPGEGTKAALLYLAGVEAPNAVTVASYDGQMRTVPSL